MCDSDKMDCSDKFPDVTIAEQRPLTNSVESKETVVQLQQPSKRTCTKPQLAILCSFIILVATIVILLVIFLGTNFGCFCMGSSKSSLTSQRHHISDSATNSTTRKCICSNITNLNSDKIVYRQRNNNKYPTGTGKEPWRQIRLPRKLIPYFYQIQLKVDLTNFIFFGSVNITVKVESATPYVIFHRSSISIIEQSVKIIPVESRFPTRRIKRQFFDSDFQFHVVVLDADLAAGSEYVIQVGKYQDQMRNNLRGLYLSKYKTVSGITRYLASSQLQSTDARRVFPCFDEPDFKAIFQITIIHQPGYKALSNMPLHRSTVIAGGWLKKEFLPTPIMSTYILAFVIADFKSRNYSFDNGYQMRVWARPEAYAQSAHALEFGVKSYTFFADYFNISDVVPKEDHVAVPDFSAGAMENWGLVIYRETALLYDPQVSSSRDKYRVTLIVAHEIAHMWFGNMVTMKWWDDLWLNEGFASTLMYFAMNSVYPEWNVFAIQLVEDMLPVLVDDGLVTSHPVSTDIEDPDDIPQLFDGISYNKGMAVLRMLQGFIGWDNFRVGLQLYIKKYKFKNAVRDQLWQTFSEAINHTYVIKTIMDTWTRQTGYPVVSVVHRNNSFHLEQTRFLFNKEEAVEDDGNTFGYKWYIPFTYSTQFDRTVKTVWMKLGSASIPATPGWLLGNMDYMGFFRVSYEKSMWSKLGEQLLRDHTIFPESNRAGLIADSFALARAQLLDYDIALNLTRYLKNDVNYVPWRAFMDSIEFLRGMIATKAAYVHLQRYLRELVDPVLDAASAASTQGTLPDKYLHRIILTLACDVGLPRAVSYAISMFNAWRTHNYELPPDLSVLIYSVGIREGGAEEWDFVWDRAQSTTIVTEREMMMEALAQTQKPWLLWRYANWIFDPEKIKHQDVRVVISHFTKTPLARMVALEFFMTSWKELVSRFGDDPFLMREVIPTVTAFVNSEFHLRQLEALFKETPPKVASKSAENALALARSNIKWMETYYEKISTWLRNNVA